jgi:CBS domain-containing protein
LNEATILTGRCGQAIGAVMIASGLAIALLKADFFTGFWMILIGLFLYDAAAGIIKDTKRLSHVSVMDVMRLPSPVPPDANLLYFIDHILPTNRQTVFPVAKDRQLYGMLLLADMKRVERAAWHTTLVQDVMRAVTAEYFVETTASLADAQELMNENGIGAVCVLDAEGKLVGFFGGGRSRK